MSFKTKTDILHTPLTQWLRKYMYVINSDDYTEKKAQIRNVSMLMVVITMVRQVT